ncbi:exodeoxyribonuclease VII small subunit [Anaerotruncus colihominis]|uniref:exodeoxyribonuclease VII small subunit n=1 Tax=Anaerotruncus colihominis TaxID=169435 RepID=UPI00242D2380|nr:exodeoxyribonuclease VII small subunit [Anaerotruncus colihominis]
MAKTMTLESAVARLEQIVSTLGGDVPLDEAVKLYAEAVKLVDFSNGKIEAARLKIEKLSAAKEDSDAV